MSLSHIVEKKFFIILSILILAGIGAFFFFKKNSEIGVLSSSSVLEDLLRFEIKDQNLNEERKELLYSQFVTLRDGLRKNMESLKKEGEKSSSLLYWPVFNIGNVHRDAGDYKKAEKAYLYAHKLQPNGYPPLGNLGELYLRYLKDYKKAEEYYLKAIVVEHDYLETYYSELYQLYRFQMKDIKKAEDILISGVEKYPKKTNILADLGLHYRQMGQKEKAVEAYKKLLMIYPESRVAKEALSELEKQ